MVNEALRKREKVVVRDLKESMIDELQEHVPDTLEGLEAFLVRQIELVKNKKAQQAQFASSR